MKSWPENPLDLIINWIKTKPRNSIIADMGCGEARLAATVLNTVHSFDLVASDPEVIACDIAHVPLEDQSVDIVVFCLSLMGTNIVDFLKEAHRILKVGGYLKIAEVRSRFEGEKNGMLKFYNVLARIGFNVTQRDSNNTMFFLLEAIKKPGNGSSVGIENLVIQPCLYKRR